MKLYCTARRAYLLSKIKPTVRFQVVQALSGRSSKSPPRETASISKPRGPGHSGGSKHLDLIPLPVFLEFLSLQVCVSQGSTMGLRSIHAGLQALYKCNQCHECMHQYFKPQLSNAASKQCSACRLTTHSIDNNNRTQTDAATHFDPTQQLELPPSVCINSTKSQALTWPHFTSWSCTTFCSCFFCPSRIVSGATAA